MISIWLVVLEGVEPLGTHGMAREGRSLGAGLELKPDSGSSRFFLLSVKLTNLHSKLPPT